MSTLGRTKRIVGGALLVLMAGAGCVVKLTDRNSPIPNGGVTGEAANCAAIPIVPKAGIGDKAELRFVGRFDARDPNRIKFDWSGNYVSARFTGTSSVAVKLAVNADPDSPDILFTVVVDGVMRPEKIRVVVGNERYEVASGLDPNAQHEVVVHRNTEAQKGPTWFMGFDLGPGQLLPPTVRPRRIEFIGDSITCGYGNEGENATCPFDVEIRASSVPGGFPVRTALSENQYLTYSSITGRALDADVTTLCWSGKGVYQNYKDNKNDKDALLTVPQAWRERTVGTDTPPVVANPAPGGDGANPAPRWDFAKEKADEKAQAVVINLGTNDFTRDNEPVATDDEAKQGKLNGDNIPDNNLDRQKFRDATRDLVNDVRRERPDAHIFLAVPPMITDQYPVDNARSDHRAAMQSIVTEFEGRGDRKVYVIELVEQGFRYGLGCDYHPNLEVHRIMADQVTGAIRSKLCW